MGLIEWTPAMSVEIAPIDEQHKRLFSYMNELYDALQDGRETKLVEKIFAGLDDYAVRHFGLEERYFREFGYPLAEVHIAQHKQFIQKLMVMKKQIPEGKQDTEDLLMFLVEWLGTHIKGMDHLYMQCFKEHGLS